MDLQEKNKRKLLKSQQAELDGVETYLRLSRLVKNRADAMAFRELAADEGRHAAVFKKYTNVVLKPRKMQAIAVSILYRLLGKRILYPLISRFEYAAIPKYEKMMTEFPEVESVKDDEKRHGDTVKKLLKNGEYHDFPILPIAAGIVLLFVIVKIAVSHSRKERVI